MRPLLHTVAAMAALGIVVVPFALTQNAADASNSINGVPICADHDPTKWHPLVKRNPDGSINCTYGHEHGASPSSVDSVFGALPLSQQISYPWATVTSSGVAENSTANKHRVYKWLVSPSMPCAQGQAPDGSSRMITAVREELHADGNLGAAVRFHSFWGQYRLTDCSNGDTGQIDFGGHVDYARLRVGDVPVPLAGDPPGNCTLNGDGRQEGSTGGPEQSMSVWYGASNRPPGCDDAYGFGPHVSVQVNAGTDGWGPVDPNNPTTVQFYADRGKHDGTKIGSDSLALWVAGFPVDATGHVNFVGHVDRHGLTVREQPGQAQGPDYIPLVIRNARSGAYGSRMNAGYNGDVPGPQGQPGYYVQNPDN